MAKKEEFIAGFESFEKKLSALKDPRAARKAIRGAMNSALTPVVNSARQNAPRGDAAHKTYKGRVVSPGFASRSIKKNVKVEAGSIVGKVGIAKEAFYALFFEIGTKYLAAKPWLEPALKNNKRVVMNRFNDGLEKWIKKLAAKK